jgi:tRNA(Ile)-lysidine synthase
MKRKNTNAQALDKNLNHIFPKFKNFLDKNLKGKQFVCGVSGGPDSLALAYLSHLYTCEKNKRFECIIVDHGVRKGSDQEAKKVKQTLLKHKIKSNIFKLIFPNLAIFILKLELKDTKKLLNFAKRKK